MFDKQLTYEQKMRRALLESRAWLNENFEAIQEEYKDKWIAIVDRKIVASNEEVGPVREAVSKRRAEAVIIRIPVEEIPRPI